MVDWITENAMPKDTQYAFPYSKQPCLGCDPGPGCGFSPLRAGGRRGVAACCRGSMMKSIITSEGRVGRPQQSERGGRRRIVSRNGGTVMRSLKSVTVEEARTVWNTIKNPSARSVARAMTQAGRKIHHATVSRWAAQDWRPVANRLHPLEAARQARWAAQDWRPVANRLHPLEAARQALDIAVGVLTGNPAAGTKVLEELSEREQLDGLPDTEVLRRSARELCISTILVCNQFQECAPTLIPENPAEAALLLKALCRAVPAAAAAYGEALMASGHPRSQDNDGTTSNDPLLDLLKRFEATSKK
jgi:hypothetical protein